MSYHPGQFREFVTATLQGFKPIAWRNSQILEPFRRVHQTQFA